MKHAVKTGSVAKISVHNKFHKDWFRQSKDPGGGGYTDKKTR
jgi:hypothetical protein